MLFSQLCHAFAEDDLIPSLRQATNVLLCMLLIWRQILLQLSHLAQMKSVYPEIFSLRYANIPKTTVEGQPNGIQLIIDMSLTDTAAEPMSTTKSSAVTNQGKQLKGNKTRQDATSAHAAIAVDC